MEEDWGLLAEGLVEKDNKSLSGIQPNYASTIV